MPERELIISGVSVRASLYEWTLTPLHGGDAIRDQANWVEIWKKDAKGRWAEVCGIWNSTIPVGGAQSMQAAEEAASV